MKSTLRRLSLLLIFAGASPPLSIALAEQQAPAKSESAPKPAATAAKPAAPKPPTSQEVREAALKRFAETVEIRFDQPYAGNDNPKQQIDVYLPKKPAGKDPLPAVVFIHGGGWSGGDRKAYVAPASALAAGGKFVAFSVGYRLSGEKTWPAQIHDCKAAIRWIRAHAKELNVDPNRIGVTGSSAGGHLVTLLGLTAGNKELEGDVGEHSGQSSAVTCVINFCGPTDMAAALMQGEAAKTDDPAVRGLVGGPLKEKADVVKATSPLTYVSKQAVPIMTVHGTADARVNYNNAEKLEAALKQAGTTHYLIPMVGAGHGIPMKPELAKRMEQFWEMYLRDAKSEISTDPIEAAPQPVKK